MRITDVRCSKQSRRKTVTQSHGTNARQSLRPPGRQRNPNNADGSFSVRHCGRSATLCLSYSSCRNAWRDLKTGWPLSQRRSEEHTSELQSQSNLVCRLLLEKKKKTQQYSGGSYRT